MGRSCASWFLSAAPCFLLIFPLLCWGSPMATVPQGCPCLGMGHPWLQSLEVVPTLTWVTSMTQNVSFLVAPPCICPRASPHVSPALCACCFFLKCIWAEAPHAPLMLKFWQAMSCSHQFQSWLDVAVTCSEQLTTFSHAASSYPNAASYAQYNRYQISFYFEYVSVAQDHRLCKQTVGLPVPKAR